jgi:hypothetical protein
MLGRVPVAIIREGERDQEDEFTLSIELPWNAEGYDDVGQMDRYKAIYKRLGPCKAQGERLVQRWLIRAGIRKV